MNENINFELFKIKQKNKDDPFLNTYPINHMFKTIEKYMSYSKVKDLYETLVIEEGRKYENNEGRIEKDT